MSAQHDDLLEEVAQAIEAVRTRGGYRIDDDACQDAFKKLAERLMQGKPVDLKYVRRAVNQCWIDNHHRDKAQRRRLESAGREDSITEGTHAPSAEQVFIDQKLSRMRTHSFWSSLVGEILPQVCQDGVPTEEIPPKLIEDLRAEFDKARIAVAASGTSLPQRTEVVYEFAGLKFIQVPEAWVGTVKGALGGVAQGAATRLTRKHVLALWSRFDGRRTQDELAAWAGIARGTYASSLDRARPVIEEALRSADLAVVADDEELLKSAVRLATPIPPTPRLTPNSRSTRRKAPSPPSPAPASSHRQPACRTGAS